MGYRNCVAVDDLRPDLGTLQPACARGDALLPCMSYRYRRRIGRRLDVSCESETYALRMNSAASRVRDRAIRSRLRRVSLNLCRLSNGLCGRLDAALGIEFDLDFFDLRSGGDLRPMITAVFVTDRN